MPRKPQAGMFDLRHHDWSSIDLSSFGEREEVRMHRAVRALEDPQVAEATYRLANFGETVSARSWDRFPEATWLLVAYQAAVALDCLPDPP
jgi:hypothetical protein